MGLFLRILVIILFPLAIVAFMLGWMLFDRREMLKGRTQKLEKTMMTLCKVIEDAPAEPSPKEHVKKDIAPCTSDPVDPAALEYSGFWTNYKDHLEITSDKLTFTSIDENKLSLYYKVEVDPVSGKISRSKDAQGYPITEGPGTMQEILDLFINKASDQLTRLDETRSQLSVIRKELEDTITTLNDTKDKYRTALRKIKELEAKIVELEAKIADLESQIVQLKDTIAKLEDTIKEKDNEIAKLKETIADREATIKVQKEEIARLLLLLRPKEGQDGGGILALDDGIKGHVLDVDRNYNFIVFEMDEAFVNELSRESRQNIDKSNLEVPLDMRRPGENGSGAYVTRVNLRSVRLDQKLAIADILPSWKQLEVQKGDEVFK